MDSIRVVETHISTLYFVGDTVLKARKPVRTDFLDFRALDARRADCEREVAMNRRFSPDVYLGVVPIVGADDEPIDYVTAMRRMPDDRRLSALAATDAPVEPCVDAVADLIARVHQACTRDTRADHDAAGTTLRTHWTRNLEQIAASDVVDDSQLRQVARLALRYLEGRGPLFDQRIAEGRAVDGHGDLLADDIFCLADGPRVLDCLEFDDDLRRGDGLLDAAFLAMDLEHLGRRDLAQRFLDRYTTATHDDAPTSLVHHYIAYRATVRALVHCIRAQQGAPSAAATAASFLTTGLEHLRAARVRMVLVGGAPGTGKTTTAAEIAAARGWELLRSDVIRKEQTSNPDYDAEAVAANYAELLARASRLLEHGRSVVLDATWSSEHARVEANATAQRVAADVIAFECRVDAPTAAARIAQRAARARDASDADARVAHDIRAAFAPWPAAHRLDTAAPVADVAAAALGWIAED